MIGAMPAVAVRHERRKGQNKRSKRPSKLCLAGHWFPPTSPSPITTPSPNGIHYCDETCDRLPEIYICGKVSALHLIVCSILLGAIVLIVGLVQLVPNAADADHRYLFIGGGVTLLCIGLVLTAVRCFWLQCALSSTRVIVVEEIITSPPNPAPNASSITPSTTTTTTTTTAKTINPIKIVGISTTNTNSNTTSNTVDGVNSSLDVLVHRRDTQAKGRYVLLTYEADPFDRPRYIN